jgi:hypothetical protein
MLFKNLKIILAIVISQSSKIPTQLIFIMCLIKMIKSDMFLRFENNYLDLQFIIFV